MTTCPQAVSHRRPNRDPGTAHHRRMSIARICRRMRNRVSLRENVQSEAGDCESRRWGTSVERGGFIRAGCIVQCCHQGLKMRMSRIRAADLKGLFMCSTAIYVTEM
jgi:hypothetical protein